MFLRRLKVHNYKSLRSIDFSPTPFSVLIGPNASGKSNFANSIHFLSEVYTHGLELAISRKGGYENIAFRKQRRTKAGIEFHLAMEGSVADIFRTSFAMKRAGFPQGLVRYAHTFVIDTPDTGIKAEFSVTDERFDVYYSRTEHGPWAQVTAFTAAEGAAPRLTKMIDSPVSNELERRFSMYSDELFESIVGKQELFINALPLRSIFRPFTSAASQFAVYQLSPIALRQPGVPTPNPALGTAGENLPALVDWLRRKHEKSWKTVISGMRDVLSGLDEVNVQYLHTKALGLFFSEHGAGRPWSADEVSDGTIQSLALFVGAADPRSSLLVMEEPENSVHPWIIRALVARLRSISETKNVIVTTHSPVLIDMVNPIEAWILSRHDGETTMRRLIDIDPSIKKHWGAGKFKLSQFLDAGFVPQAVPGGIE
jgi:predicted ATPase